MQESKDAFLAMLPGVLERKEELDLPTFSVHNNVLEALCLHLSVQRHTQRYEISCGDKV